MALDLFYNAAADLVTSLHYGPDKVYLADTLKIDSFENHVASPSENFLRYKFAGGARARGVFSLERGEAFGARAI